MMPQPQRSRLAGIVLWLPYAWLVVFFLLPFLIVLKISLSQSAIAQPPYTPVFDLSAGWSGVRSFFAGLSLDNYVFLGSDPLYVVSYMKSLQIAAFSTLLLLVIGYPLLMRLHARRRACRPCWWCSLFCRFGRRSSFAFMRG